MVSHVYEASAEAFTHSELWNLHPQIYHLSTIDITGANQSISSVEIAIHDAQEHPWLNTSVDVPSVYFSKPPTHCNIPQFLKHKGCHAVGKWSSGDPDNNKPFQLGFCLSDAEMFHTILPVLRDSYKLAKIIRDDSFCPTLKNVYHLRASQLIDSYSLKTCTFNIFLHITERKEIPIKLSTVRIAVLSASADESNTHMKEVMYWASQIYTLFGVAMTTSPSPYLESIYIPSYNLLGDHKFGQFQKVAVDYIKGLQQNLSFSEQDSSPTPRQTSLSVAKPKPGKVTLRQKTSV